MNSDDSSFGLLLFLAASFLGHKLRWKESTTSFVLAGVFAIAALDKLWVFLGKNEVTPLFLFAYAVLAIVMTLIGVQEKRRGE